MSDRILKLNGVLLNKLPENFKFDGTLDLTGSSLTELPKGLYVTADLIIGDANIHSIPEETIVGGNLIDFYGNIKNIHESAIVCGSFCRLDCFLTVKSNKTNYITLDNGDIFWYKDKRYHSHRALRNHAFDRTPFNLYYSYNDKLAVQWSTPQGTFTKICTDKANAKFLVNYQDAIERGLEKYRGLDIDTPMIGHKIFEIYQICTHSCMEGVQEYLDYFGFDLDKKYTLREIGYTVQQFKEDNPTPASDVFIYFFNIPPYKEDLI